MKHLSKEQINSLILSPDAIPAEWMAHLKACETCRAAYEEELVIHEQLADLAYHQPSLRFSKNILERVEKNRKVDRAGVFWTRFARGGILLGMIQSLLMLVILFFDARQEFLQHQLWIEQTVWWSMMILVIILSAWLLFYLDRWLKRKMPLSERLPS